MNLCGRGAKEWLLLATLLGGWSVGAAVAPIPSGIAAALFQLTTQGFSRDRNVACIWRVK